MFNGHRVAAGTEHTCAIDLSGMVWCWGNSSHGQAGGGVGGAVVLAPQPIAWR